MSASTVYNVACHKCGQRYEHTAAHAPDTREPALLADYPHKCGGCGSHDIGVARANCVDPTCGLAIQHRHISPTPAPAHPGPSIGDEHTALCHHDGSECPDGCDAAPLPPFDASEAAGLRLALKDVLGHLARTQADLAACREALAWLLPMAEAYLRHAPSHPDNAKLETARALLAKDRA